MYYTKNHPFTFEEIHEGGGIVYQYLIQRQPDLADFGLGMISHSVKYGTDKFNLDENLALLGYEDEKFRVNQDKNYISDFDREVKKLLMGKKQK